MVLLPEQGQGVSAPSPSASPVWAGPVSRSCPFQPLLAAHCVMTCGSGEASPYCEPYLFLVLKLMPITQHRLLNPLAHLRSNGTSLLDSWSTLWTPAWGMGWGKGLEGLKGLEAEGSWDLGWVGGDEIPKKWFLPVTDCSQTTLRTEGETVLPLPHPLSLGGHLLR